MLWQFATPTTSIVVIKAVSEVFILNAVTY